MKKMIMRKIGSMGLIKPMGPICLLGLIGLMALLSLASCERYEVESYYTGTANIRVDLDWMKEFGEHPSGMTIILARNGDSITYTDITNDVDHYYLQLKPGEYKMLIFNRTFGEFGSMRFFQTKSFTDIFAYAEKLQRTTEDWDVNADYMREPERIGCAVDTFVVSPDMVDGDFRFVNWRDKMEVSNDTLKLHEVVEPMVTDLNIRVKIIGFKYMADVVGNISGMADGFLLSQAWRRTQFGYHFLDNWSAKAAPEESTDTMSVGYITTKVSTFGLPHGRELLSQRLPGYNTLSLCFTLLDGTKHVFRYPVGDKIVYREAEVNQYFNKTDVTLELDLEIVTPFYEDDEVPNLPYAQPSGTGSFDAEVEPWGDDENVDIQM